MKNNFLKTSQTPAVLVRLTVGLIFLSEGIQKILFPETVGTARFEHIGFSNPEFWSLFVAGFEIVCGILLLIGLFTRFAAIPLLIIMITAFVTTKWPVLIQKGFWIFAHEYRTDLAMTMLLTYLLLHGGGKFSYDLKLHAGKRQ